MKTPDSSLQKRAAKIILSLALIIYCLMVWPGYLAHDYYTSTTNSSFSQLSEQLEGSSVIEQYFTPQFSHLYEIQFAVSYDDSSECEGYYTFLLYNENGKKIMEKAIPAEEVGSQLYYEVPVRRILNPKDTYCWKLIIPENAPENFQALYTENTETRALENRKMLINGENTDGENAQTISQYVYLSHADKALILGTYWCCGIIVYLILSECVNRLYAGTQDAARSKPL